MRLAVPIMAYYGGYPNDPGGGQHPQYPPQYRPPPGMGPPAPYYQAAGQYAFPPPQYYQTAGQYAVPPPPQRTGLFGAGFGRKLFRAVRMLLLFEELHEAIEGSVYGGDGLGAQQF